MSRLSLFCGCLSLAGTLVACGSRGPLDLELPDDAGAARDAVTPVDASALVDAGGSDARNLPPIVECGLCVTQQCGPKVLACIQDPACSKALQCIGQKCLRNGFDLQCLAQCTGSDPQTALKAFAIAQCVTGVCGGSCASGLPGILGGG